MQKLHMNDDEKKQHVRDLNKKSKIATDTKLISINGTLLNEFLRLKDKHSKELGFELTNKQFFTIVLNQHANRII